jgi:hypothetical protein
MSSTRDFVAATLADATLPLLRRPVEDLIYETLDTRQIPSRTDFKELRDLVNNLRGQLGGVTGGIKRLADQAEALDEQVQLAEGRLDELSEQLEALASGAGPNEAAVEAEAIRAAALAELAEQVRGLVAQLRAQESSLVAAHTAIAEVGLTAQRGAEALAQQGSATQAQLDALGAALSRLDLRVGAMPAAPTTAEIEARVEAALQSAIPAVLDRIVQRRVEAALGAQRPALLAVIDALVDEKLRAFAPTATLVPVVTAPVPEAPSATTPTARAAAPAAAASTAAAPCKVPDCADPARARGFCARHYQHWKRNRLPGFPNPEPGT